MLVHDGENDYTMPEGENSCWITVDQHSVYIVRRAKSLRVELFRNGVEDLQPLKSMSVTTQPQTPRKP